MKCNLEEKHNPQLVAIVTYYVFLKKKILLLDLFFFFNLIFDTLSWLENEFNVLF
jgi:hypothetical protein